MHSREFPGDPEVKTSPSNAEGVGFIPDWGAKIHMPHGQKTKKKKKKKKKQFCNKFNKDFKNGPHQKKSLKMLNNAPLHHCNICKVHASIY